MYMEQSFHEHTVQQESLAVIMFIEGRWMKNSLENEYISQMIINYNY